MCVLALAPAAAALAAQGTAGAALSAAMFSGANILANVAVFGSMAGGVMSAAGQFQQQKSANKQAEYQAKVAENNANTQKQLAEYTLEKGRLDEQRQRLQTAHYKGAQRLGYAAAGVELSGDSPLDVLEDTSGMGALDALNVRHAAKLDAWQHESGASDAFAQAGLYRSSKASPLTQSLPTMVSGASNVAGKWYGFTK